MLAIVEKTLLAVYARKAEKEKSHTNLELALFELLTYID